MVFLHLQDSVEVQEEAEGTEFFDMFNTVQSINNISAMQDLQQAPKRTEAVPDGAAVGIDTSAVAPSVGGVEEAEGMRDETLVSLDATAHRLGALVLQPIQELVVGGGSVWGLRVGWMRR